MQVISPDTPQKRRLYSKTGSKQTAILVYVRVKEEGCKKASLYAECYSLISLFLTQTDKMYTCYSMNKQYMNGMQKQKKVYLRLHTIKWS